MTEDTLEIPVVPIAEHAPEPAAGTIYTWAGLEAGNWVSLDDHPLSANCRRCGRGLILVSPEALWRHRGDGELIDSPIGGY